MWDDRRICRHGKETMIYPNEEQHVPDDVQK